MCCSRSLACPPTAGAIRPARPSDVRDAGSLVEEQAAAAYTERALAALQRAGCVGAMLWCYTDYDSAIWEDPPLDLAVHERSFGLWRADGSPKPSVAVVEAFAGARRLAAPDDYPWIDLEPEEFLVEPNVALPRLYARYRERRPERSPGPVRPASRSSGARPPRALRASSTPRKPARHTSAGPTSRILFALAPTSRALLRVGRLRAFGRGSGRRASASTVAHPGPGGLRLP